MPQYRIFWAEHTRFSTTADAMARNRFNNLRTYFHVNDNSKMLPRNHKAHDKLFKVGPFINAIRDNMRGIKVRSVLL